MMLWETPSQTSPMQVIFSSLFSNLPCQRVFFCLPVSPNSTEHSKVANSVLGGPCYPSLQILCLGVLADGDKKIFRTF